jgi:hypothetical protein
MKNPRIVTILTALATVYTAVADSKPRPVATQIVTVRSQSNADWRPVGNISVTFSDGHREVWTTTGTACFRRTHTLAWSAGLMPSYSILAAAG